MDIPRFDEAFHLLVTPRLLVLNQKIFGVVELLFLLCKISRAIAIDSRSVYSLLLPNNFNQSIGSNLTNRSHKLTLL